MTRLTEAIAFAAAAHEGATRKGTDLPYIVHPMEVAAIAATLTDDREVLAAAMLHDVTEDCGVTIEALRERFGARVAALVEQETQMSRGDPCQSWEARKREALEKIASGSRETRILALSDKLSNIRAIHRDYRRIGDAVFARFHQRDKARYGWYYGQCVELLRDELGGTDAWRELRLRVTQVFGDPESAKWLDKAENMLYHRRLG